MVIRNTSVAFKNLHKLVLKQLSARRMCLCFFRFFGGGGGGGGVQQQIDRKDYQTCAKWHVHEYAHEF